MRVHQSHRCDIPHWRNERLVTQQLHHQTPSPPEQQAPLGTLVARATFVPHNCIVLSVDC